MTVNKYYSLINKLFTWYGKAHGKKSPNIRNSTNSTNILTSRTLLLILSPNSKLIPTSTQSTKFKHMILITLDNCCWHGKAGTRLTIYTHASIIHVILYVIYSMITHMPIIIQNNAH
jgi:hypothetical protein